MKKACSQGHRKQLLAKPDHTDECRGCIVFFPTGSTDAFNIIMIMSIITSTSVYLFVLCRLTVPQVENKGVFFQKLMLLQAPAG